MATLGFTYVSNCTGGGHIALDVSLNGGASRRVVYDVDDVRKSLATMLAELTNEDRDKFILILLKLHFAGMTRAVMKTQLQAGVTVTI